MSKGNHPQPVQCLVPDPSPSRPVANHSQKYLNQRTLMRGEGRRTKEGKLSNLKLPNSKKERFPHVDHDRVSAAPRRWPCAGIYGAITDHLHFALSRLGDVSAPQDPVSSGGECSSRHSPRSQ